MVAVKRHYHYIRETYRRDNDLMVAQITPKTTGAAIKINWDMSLPEASSDVYGFGYGVDESLQIPYVLRNARFTALSRTECQNTLQAAKLLKSAAAITSDLHLCANELKVGAGLCSGDSGGPLIMKTKDGFVQVGISSYRFDISDGCGNVAVPDERARVSQNRRMV